MERLIFLVEILESSSGDEEEIDFISINLIKLERPKIKNFLDVINKYSD